MFVPKKLRSDPDERGHFGIFGGRFVPETLMPTLLELESFYLTIRFDEDFWEEAHELLHRYVGRPSLLYFAQNLSKEIGARIYLKREDLNHTGSHKINNVLLQALVAKRMGKKRIIAETGAGQHGVATATIAAFLGLECEIFMGAKDMQRQELNVFRMQLLGAKVHAATSGSQTLKDAMNEAIRDWVSNARDTFYLIGTVAGPHPYPMMVRDFQSIIGYEARQQILHAEGRLPDIVCACVGGGSNAAGLFAHFLDDKAVQCIGIEAGGQGEGASAASLKYGNVGILHGQMSYYLQTDEGQIEEAQCISAGLDYPGIGPEHAYWFSQKLVHYDIISDNEALEAFVWLSQKEGIIPALESSHALAYIYKNRATIHDKIVIICLSGRGDKDVAQVKGYLGEEN